MIRNPKVRRLLLRVIPSMAFASVTLLALCDRHVSDVARPYHSPSIESLPNLPVALVLGCSERLENGRPNLYFLHRMDAAARLYLHGKVKHLIVSGDNGRKEYDETLAMQQALIRRGVPASAITRDHAGFDTLDSVVRSRKVFGAENILIVSQAFHNERAIYLARGQGQEAWGYDAEEFTGAKGSSLRFRECLARLKALIDLHLLKSGPRYLGPPIRLGT